MFHIRRKLNKVSLKTLNTRGGAIPPFVNVIGGKAVANQYPYPEFLEETMFAEHGTNVLITDPAADKYLEQHRKKKLQDKYSQWIQEPEGDPSY